MKTQYLSPEEREKGLSYYLRFSTFNGLGFSFVGTTQIYLLALYFGATNTQIGYLSSMLQVSGLALLFIPRLLAGRNIVDVLFTSWLLRGFVCLLYTSLLLCKGQTAVYAIMIIYTIFCVIRTVGVAVSPPVQRMLSSPSAPGEVVVKTSNRFQITRLGSLFVSFLLLSLKQFAELTGLLFLQVLGVVFNTLASLQLRRIPCREKVEYTEGRNIFVILRESLGKKERAFTLLVRLHTVALMVMTAFIIAFLRKTLLFPSNMIFIYTITETLATITAGYVLKPFADRVGSKPLLIMASFFLTAMGVLWGLLPASIPWSIIFFMGFVTRFLVHTSFLLVSRLVLKSMPARDSLGYTSMMNFFTALVSLGVGLLGGLLADFGAMSLLPGFNSFAFSFLLFSTVALLNGIFSAFLQDHGSLSLKDTIAILFSTRNLKAFLDIYQLNMTEDPLKRKSILFSIGQSTTSLATDEMQRILKHPLSPEKSEVLKSLFVHPRPALLDDLLLEAQKHDSYNRREAVFALGAYPEPRVEQFLLPFLDDPSVHVRSTAAKSLARAGNTSALDKILHQAKDPSLDLWNTMNYFIAISIMDEQGSYLTELFRHPALAQGSNASQALFSLAARMLECEPALGELYQKENLQRTQGLRFLLEEAKQLQPFLKYGKRLVEQYRQEDYPAIWRWCCELLEEHHAKEPLCHLRQSIITQNSGTFTKEETLAVVYFSYQLLK